MGRDRRLHGARLNAGARGHTGRLGLFGGTFDPVHFGHLRSALELAEGTGLERLSLLPNHRPVHRGPTAASTADRLAMLALAVAGVDRLEVDPREALRDGPSYTVDTLEAVRAENPVATLVFFMGMDAFSGFPDWHRPGRILELANLVVVDRPGAEPSPGAAALLAGRREAAGPRIVDGGAGVIERRAVTQLQISATRIRDAVRTGLSSRFLLPEEVRGYIREKGLYRDDPDPNL